MSKKERLIVVIIIRAVVLFIIAVCSWIEILRNNHLAGVLFTPLVIFITIGLTYNIVSIIEGSDSDE